MSDQFDKWEKGADGAISCNPVCGLGAAIVAQGTGAVVRFEYLRSPQPGDHGAVQLAFTLPQIEELAQVLGQAAEKMRNRAG